MSVVELTPRPLTVEGVAERLRWDDQRMADLHYCVPIGLSHSRFLGREGGPDWTDEDRLEALAYRLLVATCCPSCGSHPDDFDHGQPGGCDRLMAVPWRCHGCQTLEDARAASDLAGDKGHGLTFRLVPIPDPDGSGDDDD